MSRTKIYSRTGAMVAAVAIAAVLMGGGCGGKNNPGKPDDPPPPVTYTLMTNVTPSGGGTVSRNPNRERYDAGTTVTVTATATDGYVFIGWEGASASANDTITITMNGDKTLTANFEQDVFITDPRDGQRYRTVTIGNQTWIAENLNFTADNSWCYDDADSNCVKYGRLYAWNAAMSACPAGWHLPSHAEWNELVGVAGGSSAGAKNLKSATGWRDHQTSGNGTDELLFSALPGGYLYNGTFIGTGSGGSWWNATEYDADKAGCHTIYYDYDYVLNYNDHSKDNGYSVRCVRDL